MQTREPNLNDVLHGVCLKHVTSGAKNKNSEAAEARETATDGESAHAPNYADSESDTPPVDEAVAEANDNVHRQLKSSTTGEDVMTMTSSTTAGSTSTESYDVVGELSINPNSVEETMVRIWDNDPDLTEVSHRT